MIFSLFQNKNIVFINLINSFLKPIFYILHDDLLFFHVLIFYIIFFDLHFKIFYFLLQILNLIYIFLVFILKFLLFCNSFISTFF